MAACAESFYMEWRRRWSMRRFTSEQLQTDAGAVRAEARRHPVEVTYRGRPELVVLSVEKYALLRENRKIGFHRDEMLREKIGR